MFTKNSKLVASCCGAW